MIEYGTVEFDEYNGCLARVIERIQPDPFTKEPLIHLRILCICTHKYDAQGCYLYAFRFKPLP